MDRLCNTCSAVLLAMQKTPIHVGLPVRCYHVRHALPLRQLEEEVLGNVRRLVAVADAAAARAADEELEAAAAARRAAWVQAVNALTAQKAVGQVCHVTSHGAPRRSTCSETPAVHCTVGPAAQHLSG